MSGPTNYILEAITEAYGERCPETVQGCPVCDAWAQYDALLDRIESAEKALKPFADAYDQYNHYGTPELGSAAGWSSFHLARAHLSQYGERT